MPVIQQAAKSSLSIRLATDADAATINHFQRRLNRPERSDSKTVEYFIAEIDGEIAGCAAVRARESVGYLYGLVVDKDLRRRGIGHALTQCRLDCLRETGAHSAFVLAMFWNVRFFKRHGFEVVDKKRFTHLGSLHNDLTEKWSSRSTLLAAELLPPLSSNLLPSDHEAHR